MEDWSDGLYRISRANDFLVAHIHTEGNLQLWDGAQGLDGGVHVTSVSEVA